ncbi:MAG: DUF6288 domain-containing protein, partial [Lentisphaeraceae bacterium]|nr:DUF6288 domain-containing protein [Lentisphaeraceae bacterium]
DFIIAAGRTTFKTPHIDGYGMDKFGADGPIYDFALALEEAQGWAGKGNLVLQLLRNGDKSYVKLNVGTSYGQFSKTFPENCKKSEKITDELCKYIAKNQSPNGSFGSPIENLYAPLALMASGSSKYVKHVKRNVYYQASITKSSNDTSSLVNWKYMTAGIVLSEYFLKTKDKKVLKELQEIYDFIYSTQYTDMSQISEATKKNKNRNPPKDNKKAHGGWGHNTGYQGYGPIAMITGEAALAMALMHKCGIKIEQTRLEKAYKFLARGTSNNGYTWYADDSRPNNKAWADMGRTGAGAIANFLSPYSDSKYKQKALLQAKLIGKHPQSFPDTHGSPILGMGFTALAANIDSKSFRSLMDNNKWWFSLAQCSDGSYYYQPNRDNAGYRGNPRIKASAVTAFIFLMHKKNLEMTKTY